MPNAKMVVAVAMPLVTCMNKASGSYANTFLYLFPTERCLQLWVDILRHIRSSISSASYW